MGSLKYPTDENTPLPNHGPMNVPVQLWQNKMNNLHYRPQGISSEHQINYPELLKKVFIGKTVLDVGCGDCWLQKLLPAGVSYAGLDAFPKSEDVFLGRIEDCEFEDNSFETLFVFAALDGMQDLDKAFANMKRICSKNIVILTGINIPPDHLHTFEITLDYIRSQFRHELEETYFQKLHPRIVFIEYTKA